MDILKDGTKVKVYDLLGEFVEGTIQGNDETECEGNLKDLNYYVVVNGQNFDNEIMMHWTEIELIVNWNTKFRGVEGSFKNGRENL